MPIIKVIVGSQEYTYMHPEDADEYTFWRTLATIVVHDESGRPKSEHRVSVNRKGHVFLSKQDNGPKK